MKSYFWSTAVVLSCLTTATAVFAQAATPIGDALNPYATGEAGEALEVRFDEEFAKVEGVVSPRPSMEIRPETPSEVWRQPAPPAAPHQWPLQPGPLQPGPQPEPQQPGSQQPVPLQPQYTPSGTIDGNAFALALNAYRMSRGLPPVRYNPAYNRIAAINNRLQRQHNQCEHWYTEGIAQNAAGGYGSVAALMAGWRNSSGHDRLLLDPTSTEFGIHSDGYWSTLVMPSRNLGFPANYVPGQKNGSGIFGGRNRSGGGGFFQRLFGGRRR